MNKVLIVQNSKDELTNIESLLPENEFEIFYSHNINDGLEISAHYEPDLVLYYLNKNDNSNNLLNFIQETRIKSIPIFVIAELFSLEQMRSVMEIGSDDYLTKELMNGSLLKSINTRLNKLENLRASINNKINSFDEDESTKKKKYHVLVKIGYKLKLVKFSEIVCITAMKEYSKLTTMENCKIIVRKSLKNWINILPPKSFLQIHRSTIINIEFIDKIVKTNDRTYTVHLKHITETFDFSHRYANIMRNTFPS